MFSNLITGIIGAATVLVFLGFMAISINEEPLWIIIVGVLIMIAVDIYQGVTTRNGS